VSSYHKYWSCERKKRYASEPYPVPRNMYVYSCKYCRGFHLATDKDEPLMPFCQMSARPSGHACGSVVGLETVDYDQFGLVYAKNACVECRSKMLGEKPDRPLGWDLD
jgi:hypothetical protein